MKWALDHGCKWDEDLCNIVLDKEATAVLTWARDNGHALKFDFKEEMNRAIKTDKLKLLKWFWKQGGAKKHASYCTLAAETGSLTVLKWLKKKNVPWALETVVAAASKREYSVLRWILNRQTPFEDDDGDGDDF